LLHAASTRTAIGIEIRIAAAYTITILRRMRTERARARTPGLAFALLDDVVSQGRRPPMKAHLVILLSAIAPLVAACGNNDDDDDNGRNQDVQDRQDLGQQRGQDLADQLATSLESTPENATANIAAVVRSANDGELKQAQLAIDRGQDNDVLDFAHQMRRDHTMANQDLQQVLSDLSESPKENEVSAAVAADADAGLSEIQSSRDASFDRDYMLLQVQMHAEALELVDGSIALTPDAPFKTYLTDARATIQQHLNDAIDLANAL
jgi:putative membrane protein